MRTKSVWKTHHTLMLAVLLIGAVLRLHGLVWTLPWYFHTDEVRVVSNGITVYEQGVQSYSTSNVSMSSYPPLRGWEIALTRAFLVTLFGEDVPNHYQILWGRLFSLTYALLTMIFLYHLGRRVSHTPYVGVIAALFFAVWPDTIEFGQRTVVDGAGLMFFSLCAWLSVRAYQKASYRDWVIAVMAGGLATAAKYNYASVLLIPGLLLPLMLIQQTRRALMYGLLPAGAALIALLLLASNTIAPGNTFRSLYYEYLNFEAQVEGELRQLSWTGIQPGDPAWQETLIAFPASPQLRAEANFFYLRDIIPLGWLALALVGVGFAALTKADRLAVLVLGICAVGTFIGFSLFRAVEGRQMFGALALALIFAALMIQVIARHSRLAAGIVLVALIWPPMRDSWEQNIIYTLPDTRVATARWFYENAQPGSGIALEGIPYEFWAENGYPYDVTFRAERYDRINDRDPQTWENQGFYYLVADRANDWRGGYYAGHVFQEDFDASVEVLARFEGEGYAGSDRIIMRAFRPQVFVRAQFGGVASLHGYDVESLTLNSGETLRYKLYWEALTPNGTDYIIFNHLFPQGGGEPILLFDRLAGHNGTKPSSQWANHEWLFDHFDLTLPEDAPSGDYILYVGLYDAATGERLPVAGGENGALPLFNITIESN